MKQYHFSLQAQESKTVSVCVPIYNGEDYIEETIERLLCQTYEDIELILVDDGSTDSSFFVAKNYESSRVKVYKNPGKGACSARNYAFEKSSGVFIKFMDVDDYCSETLIESQVNMLQKNTKETIVFSPLKMLFSDGSEISPKRIIDRDFDPAINLQYEIWNFGGFNCPHCYMMHRDLVLASGGWNEKLLKNQDGEYFARVLSLADMAVSVRDAHVVWRQTNNGVSAQTSRESLESVVDTYEIITKLLTVNCTEGNVNRVCAEYIGQLVYTNYPNIKPFMPKIYAMLGDIEQPLILPQRRMLKVLRFFMGWKHALRIIRQYGL